MFRRLVCSIISHRWRAGLWFGNGNLWLRKQECSRYGCTSEHIVGGHAGKPLDVMGEV